jgi:hypothetical protein
VQLEGLNQLTKSNDLIWNRNRDLPACIKVPQATTLPRSTSSGTSFGAGRLIYYVYSQKTIRWVQAITRKESIFVTGSCGQYMARLWPKTYIYFYLYGLAPSEWVYQCSEK